VGKSKEKDQAVSALSHYSSLPIFIYAFFSYDTYTHVHIRTVTFFMMYVVSLRLQVSSEKVVEKAFGEYAFCCLLLFFVVFNFIG